MSSISQTTKGRTAHDARRNGFEIMWKRLIAKLIELLAPVAAEKAVDKLKGDKR
jgi:hypothetical protein